MDATPFEQVVVLAVATNLTGDVSVDPLNGLVTVTVAQVALARAKMNKTQQ
jgi:hypothetical protein